MSKKAVPVIFVLACLLSVIFGRQFVSFAAEPVLSEGNLSIPSSAESKSTGPSKVRGNQPADIVLSPDGTRLYVACQGSDNVFVIDTTSNLIIDVIDLSEIAGPYGAMPNSLAITPDGRKVYVANIIADNIAVIATTTNRITGSVRVKGGPFRVEVSPDGRFAYAVPITSRDDTSRVSVVDVAKDRVVKSIRIKDVGRAVEFLHRGTKAFVLNSRGRIYVVDTASNKVIDSIDLGKGIEIGQYAHLAITPDDTRLYLASWDWRTEKGVVFVIDLASESVSKIEIPGDPQGIRLSPDGRWGYVVIGAGKIVILDLATDTAVGEFFWNRVFEGREDRRGDLRDLAISSDGKRAYVTGWDGDAVIVADLVARRVIDAIELNKIMARPFEIAISPDGARVYVSSTAFSPEDYSSIKVIDTGSNSFADEIILRSPSRGLEVSADGKQLYAVVDEDTRDYDRGVLVIDTATNTVASTISLAKMEPPPTNLNDVAIVPGKDKAYITDIGHRSRGGVYVLDLLSNRVAKKIDVGWCPQMVAITADGSRAYVTRMDAYYQSESWWGSWDEGPGADDRGELIVIDTATDEVIDSIAPVTTGGHSFYDLLRVTPDGSYVYWANYYHWVNIVKVSTNKVVKTLDVGKAFGRAGSMLFNLRGITPVSIAFTSDGSRAYMVCHDNFYVVVFDTGKRKFVGTIRVGQHPQGIVITLDDRFAYVTNAESEDVSVIELATNTIVTNIPLTSD